MVIESTFGFTCRLGQTSELNKLISKKIYLASAAQHNKDLLNISVQIMLGREARIACFY